MAGKVGSGCLVFSAGRADWQPAECWTSPPASWTCIQHSNTCPGTRSQTGRVSLHTDSPLPVSVTVTWLRFQSGKGQRAPVVFVERSVKTSAGASVRSSVPVSSRVSEPREVSKGHVQASVCKMRTTWSRHGGHLHCFVVILGLALSFAC